MRIYFVLILLLTVSTSVFSAEQTYIREYTYKASDLDSRVTARSNALKLIKTGVLEEIITFVNTSSDLGQQQVGDKFRSSFIHQANSRSAGFLKAKVLKETWNGYELWMQAEVSADPDKVKDELLKSLTMLKPGPAPKPSSKPAQSQPVQSRPVQAIPAQSQPAQVVQVRPQQVIVPVNTVMQDNSGYMLVSKFSQAFVLISPLRIMSMQQHSMNGEWPTKLEQIGMDEEDTSDGQYIDKVRLGNQGEIVALLSKEFGTKRVLKLSPKSIMGGTNIRWQCYTNLPVKQINTLSNFNCKSDSQLRF